MTYEAFKKAAVITLLAVGVYTFQYTQLANKTTVLSEETGLTLEEKHLIFFSEVAYYYYYYRQLVEAPSVPAGLKKLRADTKFTYPDPINVTTKVTIWQEIIAASLYRIISPPMAPLEFYVRLTLWAHALTAPMIFLTVTLLCSRTLPGLTAYGLYFAITELASRTSFQPILRESMGLPPLVFSLLLIVFFMRKPDNRLLLFIGASMFLHGLFWQFSVVTNTLKILTLFIFSVLYPEKNKDVRAVCLTDVYVYTALALVYWKNPFYLTPMYLAPLAALLITTFITPRSRAAGAAVFLCAGAGLFLALKHASGLGASSHLSEFFMDRFFGIKTYHSQLYRTVDAFGPMRISHVFNMTRNALLPLFVFSLFISLRLACKRMLEKHEALLLFFSFSYIALSAVVFRFMIIFLPLTAVYSMLMIAKLAGPQTQEAIPGPKMNAFFYHLAWVIVLAAFLLNLRSFHFVIRQSPNYMAMGVANALRSHAKPADVIAADMVTSASLAHLLENRLIVHPQYEYAENRERVKMFDRAYGYTDSSYMYNYFKSLGVDYVVLTSGRCFSDGTGTIDMRAAIHFDFPEQTPDTFCARDFTFSPYFTTLFQTGEFRILQVK